MFNRNRTGVYNHLHATFLFEICYEILGDLTSIQLTDGIGTRIFNFKIRLFPGGPKFQKF